MGGATRPVRGSTGGVAAMQIVAGAGQAEAARDSMCSEVEPNAAACDDGVRCGGLETAAVAPA